MDGDGRKISKSDGKPQTADSYVTKYGADVLRLWVCSEDFRRDIPLSEEILDQVVRSYRTLRNTIRFQLGNISDFNFDEHAMPLEELDMIDRWALSKTAELIDQLTDAMESYELHRAVQLINRFCSGVLSSTYHDIIKDRLYTLHPEDAKRRSTQTAIYKIFETFVHLIGPILPFTADEAWSFHKTDKKIGNEFLAIQSWPKAFESLKSTDDVEDAQALLDLKESKINEVLESLRSSKEIGQSLEAELIIKCAEEDSISKILLRRKESLAELFIVSSVIIELSKDLDEVVISAHHAPGVRCPRSWRWVPELVEVENWGPVSPGVQKYYQKIIHKFYQTMTTKRKSSTKAKTTSKDTQSKEADPATRGRKKYTVNKSKKKPQSTKPKASTKTAKKIVPKEVEVNSKVREIISKSAQKVSSDESEKKEMGIYLG